MAQVDTWQRRNLMTIKKITPVVLLVDEVEPCVRFWKERLGFEVTTEVPEGDKIGFDALQKGGVELMYQSYASVEKDGSFSAQGYAKGPSFLYIEVDSLDDLMAATRVATWSCRNERLSTAHARSG
jgi:catechol 2,3-dioxygenase-like lactoylglutathione lyase family enzyme